MLKEGFTKLIGSSVSTARVLGRTTTLPVLRYSSSLPPNQTDASSSKPQSRTTHFGFREIPEEDKETMVGSVFSSVASSYDVMNDTMSLGIHRLWKDNFVSSLLPRLPPSYHQGEGRPPFKCLDVAGGTGDIALRILDRAKDKFACRDIEVEVVDLNQGMLDEGRKRVAKTLYYNSESCYLLFADDSTTNYIHTR
jgi:2-methoxy-6-polyprenyl-1,4-benzoquinol methylase